MGAGPRGCRSRCAPIRAPRERRRFQARTRPLGPRSLVRQVPLSAKTRANAHFLSTSRPLPRFLRTRAYTQSRTHVCGYLWNKQAASNCIASTLLHWSPAQTSRRPALRGQGTLAMQWPAASGPAAFESGAARVASSGVHRS